MESLRLNIGAGVSYIPGYKNIDVAPRAEICLDLNNDRLPFETSSVDLVFSYHTLEHVSNYLFALGEIHRVLKHGGIFLLGVPYVTSTRSHMVNPYHVQNFNEHSFDFFDSRKSKGSAAEENEILFNKVFHYYHYVGIFHLFPPPFCDWARRHLLNVVRKIDYGLVAIKDLSKPVAITPELQSQLRRQYRECLDSRVTYPEISPTHLVRGSGLKDKLRAFKHWWNATDV
jgi:SAM-dependent methyltransferase